MVVAVVAALVVLWERALTMPARESISRSLAPSPTATTWSCGIPSLQTQPLLFEICDAVTKWREEARSPFGCAFMAPQPPSGYCGAPAAGRSVLEGTVVR